MAVKRRMWLSSIGSWNDGVLEWWSGGVVRSPRWLPWIVKRFGEMRVRVGDETVNGQVARWPHRVRAGLALDACATKFLCAARFFAKFGGCAFPSRIIWMLCLPGVSGPNRPGPN